MSKKKGRNTAWANLIGSFKYHGILESSPQISLRRIFKEGRDEGRGCYFGVPPLYLYQSIIRFDSATNISANEVVLKLTHKLPMIMQQKLFFLPSYIHS